MGCGRAGAQHAAAIAAAGGRIVAVHDVAPESAGRLSAITHAPIRSLPELLVDPAVDVVAVCTPPDSHVMLGLQILAAGKAAVIEKPPALSREGVEELEAACKKHGRPLAVMLQHRGRLPEIALRTPWSANASAVVEVFRFRPAAHYAPGTWRNDPSRSGGGLFAHLAIHYTDLACQVLGEPEHVHAIVEEAHTRGIDARLALSVRMASGALLTVHAELAPSSAPGAIAAPRRCTLTHSYHRQHQLQRDRS